MIKFPLTLGLILILMSCAQDKPEAPPKDSLLILQEAIKVAPSYGNYISLGMEQARRHNYEAAMNAYEKAKAINPKAPVAWNNICALLNVQGKYAESIPNCEKALELEPKFQLASNNLKHAQAQLPGQIKALLSQKAQILSKPDAPSNQLINLGLSLYRAGELESAIEVWSPIAKSDKLYALAQNNLASAFIRLKKYHQAEAALQEALNREPSNTLFLNNKKWLEDSRR